MGELITQSIYSGVLQGGGYALIALGLALIFGTMKVINLAHGELVLLAAYIAYTFESKLHLNPLLSIPAAVIVVCACSLVVYYLVKLIRRDQEINSLILTYGLGFSLTNLVLIIWSADPHSSTSEWLQDAVTMGNLYSMRSEAISFLAALVLLAGLWWWLSRSWYGRAVRAVSSNPEGARLMGINPRAAEIVSFLVGGLLAAVAGVAVYSYGSIEPSLGEFLTIKAFIITVLAGVGSVFGVLVGGLILGVAEALTVTLGSSSIQQLTGMVIFLIILVILPNGLFGTKLRKG